MGSLETCIGFESQLCRGHIVVSRQCSVLSQISVTYLRRRRQILTESFCFLSLANCNCCCPNHQPQTRVRDKIQQQIYHSDKNNCPKMSWPFFCLGFNLVFGQITLGHIPISKPDLEASCSNFSSMVSRADGQNRKQPNNVITDLIRLVK